MMNLKSVNDELRKGLDLYFTKFEGLFHKTVRSHLIFASEFSRRQIDSLSLSLSFELVSI